MGSGGSAASGPGAGGGLHGPPASQCSGLWLDGRIQAVCSGLSDRGVSWAGQERLLAHHEPGELRRLLLLSSSDNAASTAGTGQLGDVMLSELVLSGETNVLQSGEPGRIRL